MLRAHDGAMALELARTAAPAAVVLDILLPGSTAGRCSPGCGSDPATAGIPVVVVSVVDDRARGTELGAAAYLVKPLDRDELVTALRRVGALPPDGDRGGGLMAGATILVVEDNRLNMKLVRDVLEHAGYDVVEADHRRGGRRAGAARRPDLVLMDLQLPGIDGTEALRRIRRALRAGDAGRGRHRLGHALGPGGRRAGRLRRLPGEADQRPCPARPGRLVPGGPT